MITILVANIKEKISEEKLKIFETYLTSERVSKLKKFKFKEDYLRSLYGEILVRYLVNKKFFISNSQIKINYSKYGKPYIENLKNFQFNISHSGDWVVCAYGKENIGVDIEKIETAYLNISEMYFSKSEHKMLCEKSKNEQNVYFYQLWTLKESYLKYMGKGLSVSLNSFSIIENNEKFYIKGLENNVILKQYKFNNDYIISVCSKEKCNNEIKKISMEYVSLI